MNRTKLSFTILIAAFAGLSILASCHREKILKKDQVATIMFELFVADEYAKTYVDINKAADSILLYQHVFDKHECTLEDYQRSIKHYLSDDKAYSYILKTATQMANDSAKAAIRFMNTEKTGLYFPVPFKAPTMMKTNDDWWNKDIRGEKIRYDKFFQELQKIMVKEKPAPQKIEEPQFIAR